MFWLLISEIYPVKIRGQAMSVATMANWGANFVVTISFLTLLGAIGNAGTFFLFAGLSIVALTYFQRQVPETKNRSLQDAAEISAVLIASPRILRSCALNVPWRTVL